jgi:hydroxymethylglutaryl-CoA lyase
MNTSSDHVQIIEVSPRDGLQNESTLLGTAAKVELIERAIDAGARRIEATSFVNPKLVPQMADAEDVVRNAPRSPEVSLIGLALNDRGYDRALAVGVDEVNFVVVASDTFNRRNQGASTDETLASWAHLAERARADGLRTSVTVAASFGCPFEGEVPLTRLMEVVERVLETPPDELALADTIGVAVPTDVTRRLGAVSSVSGDIPLRCHFHNTRNTGIANAVAAVEAGVRVLDASIGGIGGCPFAPAATGNVPTEDLVYMFERMGLSTGLDLDKVCDAARWLGSELGYTVPGFLSRAGGFPTPAAS